MLIGHLRTVLIATVASLLLLTTAPLTAAWSQEASISDVEATAPGAVEVAAVDFDHGKKRIKVRADFAYLSPYVEYYRIELRGPKGHTWSLGWTHESAVWNDRKRVKWLYLYEPEFRHLRCKVRWHEDLDARVVKASFPSTCLRVGGKRVPWLKMQFSADDFYEESNIVDYVPGGGSSTGLPGKLTRKLRRG